LIKPGANIGPATAPIKPVYAALLSPKKSLPITFVNNAAATPPNAPFTAVITEALAFDAEKAAPNEDRRRRGEEVRRRVTVVRALRRYAIVNYFV
jgi:hypothetical protein